jgi:hypothetical protein
MRVFFVFSATVWSWIVGRSIAFGIGAHGCTWMPDITADSWYRLTHIPYPIPHKWFETMPVCMAIAFIPTFVVDSDIIHAVSVVSLTLQHAFVPLFVAQKHSGKVLSLWGTACILCTLFTMRLLLNEITALTTMAGVTQLYVCILMCRLTAIQVYVTFFGKLVSEPPEETPRVPRTV